MSKSKNTAARKPATSEVKGDGIPARVWELVGIVEQLRAIEDAGFATGDVLDDVLGELCDLAAARDRGGN